jgi:uridine kinase
MRASSPIIIGVSGIAGAGKSIFVQRLAQSLQATTLFWDDFDAIFILDMHRMVMALPTSAKL